jgi:hypothetical protein
MRDITFIEENADRTADGNVNFLKLFRMGRQLHWFVHFSRSDYAFTMDFHIQKVLMDLKFLTDAELYTQSLASEPKHPGTLGPSHANHTLLIPRVSEIVRGESPQPHHPPKRSSWRKSTCWGSTVSVVN